MRHKHELYPEEQKNIKAELLHILELDDHQSILLSDLDNNASKQQQIMSLLPSIRTFFSMSRITAFAYPESAKRPWLSIIRHLLKDDYEMVSADWRVKIEDGRSLRTKRYYFHKKKI
jgi:hypothetical protein